MNIHNMISKKLINFIFAIQISLEVFPQYEANLIDYFYYHFYKRPIKYFT